MNPVQGPWAEVDLGALADNIAVLRRRLPTETRLLAVVKCNAYGHGAAAVAQEALRAGAWGLGVARIDEGVQLREAGITGPILVFGAAPGWAAQELAHYRLTATVTSREDARDLSDHLGDDQTLAIHAKVDTGMGRLGLYAQDADPSAAIAAIAGLPGLRLEGLYTHLACAEAKDPRATRIQIARFRTVLTALDARGLHIPLRHVANSAATLAHPEAHFDLVRCGLALYGYGAADLKPVMTLKARIVQLRRVPAGTTIGYGMTHRTRTPTTIATVCLGYGDGYSRRLSGCGRMLVRGRPAPIAGRVCMDLTMLDVGGIPGVAVGDEVIALGRQAGHDLGADLLAGTTGGIAHEILATLGQRVRRIYLAAGLARAA